MKRFQILMLLASITVVVPTSCALIKDRISSVPTDAEREARFREDRKDFERLVAMSDEDPKVIRIAYDFTSVLGEKQTGTTGKDRPIGFSQERWDAYKDFFGRLGLEAGITRSEDGNLINFTAYTRGLSTGGIEKGFMFSRIPVNCVVSSLDDLKALQGREFACKSLEGNWFLYLSR